MPDSSAQFVERLRARSLRAFAAAGDITATLSAFRGVVGPRVDELDPAARSAHDLLSRSRLPTPAQIAALEYAIRLRRPAPLVKNDSLVDDTPFPLWSAFRGAVGALAPAVGRIDRLESDGYGHVKPVPVGSGFLVRPRLLLTNRHVLGPLTSGAEVIGADMARVVFRFEWGTTEREPPVRVAAVAAVHPELDLALLALDAEPVPRRPELDFATEPAGEGDAVVALGYPGDDAENPVFVSPLFGDRFGVLRASPGEVLEVAAAVLHHDCTTLRGSSGSPVLSMASGRVVGVHASGVYLYRNTAVLARAATRFVAEAA